jgi:genome maintenance exonuclease 1
LNFIDILPTVQLIRNDGGEYGRNYTTPEGNIYESVTTWLSRSSDSSALADWRAAVGEEYANEVSRRASSRGTLFHKSVENLLVGNPVDYGKNILLKEQIKLFKPVLNRVSNIRAIECPLYSDTLKLAGTTDCIASFDGTPSIIDWKTSNNSKSMQDVQNYWIQLTIYSIMVEELFTIKIPQLVLGISVDNMPAQVMIGRRSDWFPELARRMKNVKPRSFESSNQTSPLLH